MAGRPVAARYTCITLILRLSDTSHRSPLVTSAPLWVKLVRHPKRGYSRCYVNIGKLFMSLWQFTVIAFLAAIAALMGAVLVYARVLTSRIGSTNATLKRLEEALLT